MIKTRRELKEYLKADEAYFRTFSKKVQMIDRLTNADLYATTNFLKKLRKEEFYFNNRKNPFYMLMYIAQRRRRMKLGKQLGFTIEPNSLGKGARLEHYGSVVINADAKIGENCCLRGNNCIGMGGDGQSPVIGDRVDIGFGAVIIGGIEIADDVKIGAGAVVVKSCSKKGATLVGVPAREL